MANNYSNPFSATLQGILNMFKSNEPIGELQPTDRIDGKICLVTGANSGLGFAIATQLAERGGRVIMACRSGIPEAGNKIAEATGSDKVEMMNVDLSNILSINELCDELVIRNVKLDIVVCNAGMVPAGSRRSSQGFDEMFMVNYLSTYILLNRLWNDGLFRFKEGHVPRTVIISSESHRSGKEIDFDELGVYQKYKMGKVVGLYGYYKLLLNTMTYELNNQWNKDGNSISTHMICPGAVNSNIAKEAPKAFKPLLRLVFGLFFQDPAKAARPVVYLCCSPDIEGQQSIYLHMSSQKNMDGRATNPKVRKQLMIKTEALLKPYQAGSLS